MREAPSDPIPFVGNEKCATCADKDVTRGYQFDGSTAVFCEECAHYVNLVRMGSRHAEYQAHLEERYCRDCGELFTCYASEHKIRCDSCVESRAEERKQGKLFDLFAPLAQKVGL